MNRSWIDRLSRWAGHCSAVAVGLTVLLATLTALGRKWGWGSNALLELQWYLFALIFLWAAAWTLQTDGHVRVDVLAKRWSVRTRAWVDVVGHVLVLLPLCMLLLWLGGEQAWQVWQSGERSADAGGLIRWPVWALVPTGFALLLLQTLLDLWRKLRVALGAEAVAADVHPSGAP
jgi:TRAP-type mannitol/chloroaromatic compound transport system permease small subunit